ncbi:hypothetical protein BG015_008124 [Linnemannia schmuckeri]|uniref:Uncharacterized protein n=1 Tax=Linnemannia schmuckeri TaxID=64567 RepID=A0A9P5RXS7_9FUNG|nr:hypothetical protein BG015_008124 [Linnemannia schmuckeri]
MWTSLPPSGSTSPTNTGNISRSNSWSMKTLLSTTTLLLATLLPQVATAQLQCQQFGSDTFRVGSMIKYFWTGAELIPSFNIDLYCYENNKYIQTIGTIDTSLNASNYSWVVDQSITNNLAQCQFNQYQGRFTWNTTDAETGALTQGSTSCKIMLLVGPGVVGPSSQPDPSEPQPTSMPEDDLPIGQIEVSDKTKKIVIGVGCAVGALVLAGFVGFYYIRFKNKRAVEKSASRKLREPLQPDLSRPGMGPGAAASQARYNELGSVTTSVVGYSPLQRPGEMVELGRMPPAPSSSGASSSSRPHSFDYRSGSPTPIASRHAANSSGLLPQPSGSFISDRPPSVLTSSFTPPSEDPNPFQSRPSGRAPPPPPSRAPDGDEERQLYEQQFQQQQQQHQQQIQQQQMHQQQQQQLQQSYTGYQY